MKIPKVQSIGTSKPWSRFLALAQNTVHSPVRGFLTLVNFTQIRAISNRKFILVSFYSHD